MNKEEKSILTRKIALVGGIALFVIIMIIWGVIVLSSSPHESIVIGNFDKYINNLPNTERTTLEIILRQVVDLNSSESGIAINDAFIRDGSTSQERGEDRQIYKTTFIVDIPSIKQSYKITNYFTDNIEYFSADYRQLVTCLGVRDLIYGDFNCKDRFSTENNLTKSDPILMLLPYRSDTWTADRVIGFNDDNKAILIISTYIPRTGDQAILDEFIKPQKVLVEQWLRNNNLDPNDYEMVFQ